MTLKKEITLTVVIPAVTLLLDQNDIGCRVETTQITENLDDGTQTQCEDSSVSAQKVNLEKAEAVLTPLVHNDESLAGFVGFAVF